MHKDLSFAFMTLELDRLYQDLDRTDSQNCTSETNKLVYQMTLYHAQRELLVEVCESDYNNSLVSNTLDIESNIVKSQGHTSDEIIRVLIEIFQKLLDVIIAALKQGTVVNIDHN